MARTRTGNRRTLPAEVKKARRLSRIRRTATGTLRLLGVLLVVLGTFSAVIAAYLWVTTTPHLAVRDVRFEGNARARLETLVPLAAIRPGTNLMQIDPRVIARRVTRHPWVRSAVVERVFPATLVITLEEHQARALAVHDGLYLVDTLGVPFKAFEVQRDPGDLPVITGLPPEASPSQLHDGLLQALAVLDRWQAVPGRRALAEIHLDLVRGTILTLSETEDAPPLVAHLGQDDEEARLSRLDELLQVLSERGEHPREVFVDGHTRPLWVVARVE